LPLTVAAPDARTVDVPEAGAAAEVVPVAAVPPVTLVPPVLPIAAVPVDGLPPAAPTSPAESGEATVLVLPEFDAPTSTEPVPGAVGAAALDAAALGAETTGTVPPEQPASRTTPPVVLATLRNCRRESLISSISDSQRHDCFIEVLSQPRGQIVDARGGRIHQIRHQVDERIAEPAGRSGRSKIRQRVTTIAVDASH
jgi:hypothetical protein